MRKTLFLEELVCKLFGFSQYISRPAVHLIRAALQVVKEKKAAEVRAARGQKQVHQAVAFFTAVDRILFTYSCPGGHAKNSPRNPL